MQNQNVSSHFYWQKLNKNWLIKCWIFQICVAFGWFIYIFGVLGHVCPIAFLGMWNSSLIGCVAFKSRKPSFLGTFLSFIVTAAIWLLTFFILHPPIENRFINLEPFIALLLLPFILLLIQILLSKKKSLESKRIEIKIASIIETISMSAGIPIIISFFMNPMIKRSLYTTETKWFDTVFYGFDIYNLFAVISIVWIFSILCSISSRYLAKKDSKSEKKLEIIWILKYLGLTFFGFLFIGTVASFLLLGMVLENNEK